MEETGENVSRTGRQRKKSAKVLEMEAEADELEEVLKARADPSPKNTAANLKAAKAKSLAKRALAKAMKEQMKQDETLNPPQLSPEPAVLDSPAPSETVSKSGRVRKKSAKLLEMVEVEGLDRKIFRSSDLPKSMRTPAVPSQPSTPAKKIKLQTSPVRSSTVSTPSGSTVTSQGGSTIQLLLTSPVKKSPGGPGSPPPEPILLTLGASLNTPSKVQQAGSFAGNQVTSPGIVLSPPVLTAAAAAPIQPPSASPPGILKKSAPPGLAAADGKPKEFEVKFLADCPDVVLPPKPVKRKSKKQANPTPSAPALPHKDTIKPVTPPKVSPAKVKKSPTATVMADQPLLSKMMGEVGHATIGPPPPSSAEAKSMKKKAMKQAKEAAKMAESHILMWPEPSKKKVKDHLQMEQKVLTTPIPVLQTTHSEAMAVNYGDDGDEDEDEANSLMIDTSTIKSPKSKSPKIKKEKKEKSSKSKSTKAAKLKEQMIQARIQSELILKQELERAAVEGNKSHDDDQSNDEDEFEGMGGPLQIPELPSYANTHEMANKLLTSSEKKASKEKKKKKSSGAKEDAEKGALQKKRRGPTAYMLYCNAQRAKLVTDNPGIDFATISRRLGEMWQGQSDKEKMSWKKKAKKLASKGSTVINTGKGTSKMLHGGTTTPATKSVPVSVSGVPTSVSAVGKAVSQQLGKVPVTAGQAQRTVQDTEAGPSHIKQVAGITPLDVAAHLKLLGESLSIIGARLQEHHGQIAVQGTLPVLLDSLLCALGPLTCLTSNVEELNGAPLDTHTSTLDNIAYIMPGIG